MHFSLSINLATFAFALLFTFKLLILHKELCPCTGDHTWMHEAQSNTAFSLGLDKFSECVNGTLTYNLTDGKRTLRRKFRCKANKDCSIRAEISSMAMFVDLPICRALISDGVRLSFLLFVPLLPLNDVTKVALYLFSAFIFQETHIDAFLACLFVLCFVPPLILCAIAKYTSFFERLN